MSPSALSSKVLAEAITYVVGQNPEGLTPGNLASLLAIPVENLIPAVRDLVDLGSIRLIDGVITPK